MDFIYLSKRVKFESNFLVKNYTLRLFLPGNSFRLNPIKSIKFNIFNFYKTQFESILKSKLITQQMIRDFVHIHYHPSRMVLVVTGAVEDHDNIVKMAEQYFTRSDSYVGPGTPTFPRNAKFIV